MEIRKMQSSSVKKNYFAIPRFYISDALLQIDLLSICVFVRRACLIAPNNIYRVGVKFTTAQLHSCPRSKNTVWPELCSQSREE